jgi:hypothetical protein
MGGLLAVGLFIAVGAAAILAYKRRGPLALATDAAERAQMAQIVGDPGGLETARCLTVDGTAGPLEDWAVTIYTSGQVGAVKSGIVTSVVRAEIGAIVALTHLTQEGESMVYFGLAHTPLQAGDVVRAGQSIGHGSGLVAYQVHRTDLAPQEGGGPTSLDGDGTARWMIDRDIYETCAMREEA